jgi:hypothetical protein
MFKWNKLGRLSAYARAESHLLQHTSYGAIGEICGRLLAAGRAHRPRLACGNSRT